MSFGKDPYISISGWIEFDTHKAYGFRADMGEDEGIIFVPKSQSDPEFGEQWGPYGSVTMNIRSWLVKKRGLI